MVSEALLNYHTCHEHCVDSLKYMQMLSMLMFTEKMSELCSDAIFEGNRPFSDSLVLVATPAAVV